MRADLAGGTLDLWPLFLLHENSSTVNVALQLKARVSYEPGGDRWELRAGDHGARQHLSPARLGAAAASARAGDPFSLVVKALHHAGVPTPGRLTTWVEGPAGGGIGGSSALLIAIYGLAMRLAGTRLPRARLADLARDLEAQVLRLPTGVQDYYPAIYGGALQLHYGPGTTRVERIDVDLHELESRLVLAYSGKPHSSAPSNWGLYRRRLEGEPLARDCFDQIAGAAKRAGDALRSSDWQALAVALNADWKARKRLDPSLAPEDLQRLEAAGRRAGVAAVKCCGAASGGCMLFLLRDPVDRPRVEAAIRAAGAQLLAATIARRGLRVTGPTAPRAQASD